MADAYVFGGKEEKVVPVYFFRNNGTVRMAYRPELIAMHAKNLEEPNLINEVNTREIDPMYLESLNSFDKLKDDDFNYIQRLVRSEQFIDYIGIRNSKAMLITHLSNAFIKAFPESKRLEDFVDSAEIVPGFRIKLTQRPKTKKRDWESYDVVFLYLKNRSEQMKAIKEIITKTLSR